MSWAQPRWVAWLPWISLAAFSALWLARWPAFPLFLDPSYHLLVARQVLEAGGPITYEWWEAAPVGRPHLYPPGLHLLLAGLLQLGCSPLGAIRLVSALVVPGVLVSIYLVMRRLFGRTTALASLLLATAPFLWIVEIGGRLAAGLALIELLWLFAAVAQGRVVAAACLLALLFWTHLGLPWVALAGLACAYALKALPRGSSALPGILGGIVLGVPWVGHLAIHRQLFAVTPRTENAAIELLPLLVALAAFGAWRAWKQAGTPRLLLGLWLGFGLMAYPFTFRWVSGEGVLPLCLLAGYGLADLAQRLTAGRRPAAVPLTVLAISLMVMASPSALVSASGLRLRWLDTSPFHLLQWRHAQRKGIDVQLSSPRTERLAGIVAELSRPGEILWSNAPYAGGLVAALSNRATSSAMFYEVAPRSAFDPIAAAHLIVWFRIPPFPGTPDLERLTRRYRLEPVVDTDLARVLRNPRALELAHQPKAVIPFWLAGVLLCGGVGLIVWDFHRMPSS